MGKLRLHEFFPKAATWKSYWSKNFFVAKSKELGEACQERMTKTEAQHGDILTSASAAAKEKMKQRNRNRVPIHKISTPLAPKVT